MAPPLGYELSHSQQIFVAFFIKSRSKEPQLGTAEGQRSAPSRAFPIRDSRDAQRHSKSSHTRQGDSPWLCRSAQLQAVALKADPEGEDSGGSVGTT